MLFDIWGDDVRALLEILRRGCAPARCSARTTPPAARPGSYGPMFEFIDNPANGLRTMTLPFNGGFELTVKV